MGCSLSLPIFAGCRVPLPACKYKTNRLQETIGSGEKQAGKVSESTFYKSCVYHAGHASGAA